MSDDEIDWERWNTPAHREVQAQCRHVIHCAVDGDTRKGVHDAITYARRVGDMAALPILLAQLGGPCRADVMEDASA